jgi:hypothetical protein
MDPARVPALFGALALCAGMSGRASAGAAKSASAAERREALRAVRDKTPQDFHATDPAIREEAEKAVGYAGRGAQRVEVTSPRG